jgi:hypothetical protein
MRVQQCRVDSFGMMRSRRWEGPRKSVPVQHVPTVPQTDTGGQVEDTKVFERTIVKELGNLTP